MADEIEKQAEAAMSAIPGVDRRVEPSAADLAAELSNPGSSRTAAHAVTENAWRDRIAAALTRHGYGDVRTEVPVPHGRIDIAFAWHAVEIDWAAKWAESIGQALYYALATKSKAVCLLLVEGVIGLRHVENARTVARNNTPPLQVWVLDVHTGTLDMGDGRKIEVANGNAGRA